MDASLQISTPSKLVANPRHTNPLSVSAQSHSIAVVMIYVAVAVYWNYTQNR